MICEGRTDGCEHLQEAYQREAKAGLLTESKDKMRRQNLIYDRRLPNVCRTSKADTHLSRVQTCK
jgi:hypothetical protein